MLLRALHLAAYGPFTDATLDFPAQTGGLHVVFGPNEAGKSSALRAVTNLFYGIPHATQDNFLHPNKALRIGAELMNGSGESIRLTRRKGRKNTLQDDSGAPMDEAVLARLLSGVDRDMFEALFGISHETLAQGGRDILSAGGSLGESLFAAGSGIAHLRDTLSALGAEQDALFKARGSNPRINSALANLKQHRQDERDAATTPEEYTELEQELTAHEKRRDALQQTISELTRAMSRLQRLGDARPVVSRQHSLRDELTAVADAPLLPDDFPTRRHDALAALKSADSRTADLTKAIDALEADIAALDIPQALLHAKSRIESLTRTEETHRKALTDRTALTRESREHAELAERLLHALRPDLTLADAETIRLSDHQMAAITHAAKQLTLMQDREDRASRAHAQARQALAHQRETLGALPQPADVTALANILEQTRAHGDLRKQYTDACTRLSALQEKASSALSRMDLPDATLDTAEQLPVPPVETVRNMEKEFRAQKDREAATHTALDQARAALRDRQAELDQLRSGGEVPSRDTLTALRQHRDGAWQLVRQAWTAGDETFRDSYPTPDALADAFQSAMSEADNAADALFRDAKRVTRTDAARQESARLEADIARLETESAALSEQRATLEDNWTALWKPAGITPHDPEGMLSWLKDLTTLRTVDAAEIRDQRGITESIASTVCACRDDILACLRDLGTDLPPDTKLQHAVAAGDDVVRAAEAARRTREDADAELRRLERAAKDAEAALADAQAAARDARDAWESALAPLAMPSDAKPDMAETITGTLTKLFTTLDARSRTERRITDITADYDAYARDVQAAIADLAPDLDGLDALDAVPRLGDRLATAEANNQRSILLTDQLHAKRDELATVTAAAQEAAGVLEALRAEAGVASTDELPQAEERSRTRRRAETGLREAEEQLRTFRGGEDADTFIKDVLATDPDAAAAELAELERRKADAEAQRSELERAIGSLQSRREAMDGTSRAARSAELAEQTLAAIQTDVDRYIRLRLAHTVLANAIERYRKAHQTPVLTRASELFSRLTLESFSGLQQDIDERDTPVIVGVRNGEDTVPVTGMSDGTRDQLYLSLRLAALERYLDANAPLPFVVDDILVHFDDERSAATLGVLAELARRTQVIFFTHHERLCEIAADAVPQDLLNTIRLPR